MKKVFFVVLLLLISFRVLAQNTSKKGTTQEPIEFEIDSTVVLTMDNIIKSLYTVISGEKGAKRNWKQFKFLFKKDSKLIPSGKTKKDNYKVNFMSPDDYIKSATKWFESNGFYEKEILRRVEYFGNMAHAFSSYECFHSLKDKEPFMRGINSIQLFNDGDRWWIINIFWAQESEESPIPEVYLKR
ncbi:hypothetical protein [Cognatitamlana onchidii]|uniref:hypothetical protein n=1 Tax=Cognatitamlana onchidii TaxID=2562860 RepID=UPI0010A5D161|nr:hypothetical protein [Algibacter onchidii]